MKTSILLAALALSACASSPPMASAPAPTCANPSECDRKWSAARAFVLDHAGYKIETYSADFMQTYSPVGGSPSLGAQVNRQSLADGSTAIVAKFWCDNPFGCIPKADVTLNQFTATVNAAH